MSRRGAIRESWSQRQASPAKLAPLADRQSRQRLWRRRRSGDAGTVNRVRRIVQVTAVILLGVMIAGLLALFLLPLARPLAFAAVLAIACAPLQRLMLGVTRGRQGLAALLVTFIVILVGIVPIVFLGSALVSEAAKAYEGLRAHVVSGELRQRVDSFVANSRAVLPGHMAEDAARLIEHAVDDIGASSLRVISERLGGWLNAALENLPGLMLALVIMLLSLFIFLREGKQWIAGLKDAVPLPPGFHDLLASRLRDTTRAVVQGMFIAAIAQSLLLGLGFKLFGLPLPVLFGAACFFASLLPYVGTATIWIPASLWLWLGQDDPARAAGLFVYGALLVSSIDNVLTPLVVGGGARLPAYAMFLAIIGGLLALGPLGLFLGPMVFAVAFAAVGAYRELVTVTHQGSTDTYGRRSRPRVGLANPRGRRSRPRVGLANPRDRR
jgi:predicted PurR-regulated permease PerM